MPEMWENLSPPEIVAELDRYIVGQAKAKRAVAIALPEPLPSSAAAGGNA